MQIVPIMWSVWGALVVVMAILYLYRSRLTRDEEDQIYLDDSFNHQKNTQALILAKVEKIQPVMRTALALTGLATVFVVGYYILDVYNQFK